MEASETLENPQAAIIQEIHNQYWVLLSMAAKMEARKYTGGGIDRLIKFREPLIKLISLASFNPRFAELSMKFYPKYQKKMLSKRISVENYLALTNETLIVWRKTSEALRVSKIIKLQGD